MAVNEALTAYSTTAASNTPAGSDAVGTDLDDHLRDIKKNVRNASNMAVQALKTAAYSTVLTDHNTLIQMDCSASAQTISLLAAATAGDGYKLTIKKAKGVSSRPVIIDGNAAETINGATTLTLTASGQAVLLACDGSNYHIASGAESKIADELSISAFTASADLVRIFSQQDSDIRKASLYNAVNAALTNHPAVAKAWCSFTGATGATLDTHNITSVVRNSAGNYTVTLAVTMATTDYVVLATCRRTSGVNHLAQVSDGTMDATSFILLTNNTGTGSASDPTEVFFAVFGARA